MGTIPPIRKSRATSASDNPDEWPDAPTRNDSTQDTAPHDLNALARVAAVADDATKLVYSEGQEDAIRALYEEMRARQGSTGITGGEMDAIVLAVRSRFTRL